MPPSHKPSVVALQLSSTWYFLGVLSGVKPYQRTEGSKEDIQTCTCTSHQSILCFSQNESEMSAVTLSHSTSQGLSDPCVKWKHCCTRLRIFVKRMHSALQGAQAELAFRTRHHTMVCSALLLLHFRGVLWSRL